jgi:transitional endoplasmic reticulum ATPase
MNKICTVALSNSFLLDDRYKILLFIKKGVNSESYRVKDKLYFFKLFNATQFISFGA